MATATDEARWRRMHEITAAYLAGRVEVHVDPEVQAVIDEWYASLPVVNSTEENS